MKTLEAIGNCPIYKNNTSRGTPEGCKRIAETRATVEQGNSMVVDDPDNFEFYRDFCKPIEDCRGRLLNCCNPDVFPALLNISKH